MTLQPLHPIVMTAVRGDEPVQRRLALVDAPRDRISNRLRSEAIKLLEPNSDGPRSATPSCALPVSAVSSGTRSCDGTVAVTTEIDVSLRVDQLHCRRGMTLIRRYLRLYIATDCADRRCTRAVHGFRCRTTSRAEFRSSRRLAVCRRRSRVRCQSGARKRSLLNPPALMPPLPQRGTWMLVH